MSKPGEGASRGGEGRRGTAHEVHGGEGELVLDGGGELLVVDHELGLVEQLVRHVEQDAVLQLRRGGRGGRGRGGGQVCTPHGTVFARQRAVAVAVL